MLIKVSFPLRISSVNVIKSANLETANLVIFTEETLLKKTSFFVQCSKLSETGIRFYSIWTYFQSFSHLFSIYEWNINLKMTKVTKILLDDQNSIFLKNLSDKNFPQWRYVNKLLLSQYSSKIVKNTWQVYLWSNAQVC